MQKKKPLDLLIAFLRKQPKARVGAKVTPAESKAVLALAQKHDGRVHELMTLLVNKPAAFCVFDVEMYGEYLLRGKKHEPWNEGEKVVGADDVCIARNGAGDPYVWNASSGEIRFLTHDDDWAESSRYDDIDTFVEELMLQVVEAAYADQIDGASKSYLACLRFAIEIAGDGTLDDEVRDKLDAL
jgi:hypothetical protein